MWQAFEANYQAQKYPFAFLSLHMLFMSFVYFKIWQIKTNNPEDFTKAMIGFGKDADKIITTATNPFTYSLISESHIFRFFKLIGLDSSDIGRFTKMVKDRNDSAHANGDIYLRDQENLEQKINDLAQYFSIIQNSAKTVIQKTYSGFLENSQDPDNREWSDDENQVREVLIHQNYFSLEDIRMAQAWDIALLSASPAFPSIQSLAKP